MQVAGQCFSHIVWDLNFRHAHVLFPNLRCKLGKPQIQCTMPVIAVITTTEPTTFGHVNEDRCWHTCPEPH